MYVCHCACVRGYVCLALCVCVCSGPIAQGAPDVEAVSEGVSECVSMCDQFKMVDDDAMCVCATSRSHTSLQATTVCGHIT